MHREVETDENGNPRKRNGKKVYGAEKVLFEDGAPLVRAQPLVAPGDFYAVKAALEGRQQAQEKRTAEPSLLANILFCGHCGEPMWRLPGGPRRKARYRCASASKRGSCGSGSVTVAEADEYATEALFSMLSNIPHIRREYVGGSDTSQSLREIDAQLASLGEAVTRFPAGSAALSSLLGQVDTSHRPA